MNIVRVAGYEELSQKGAEIVAAQVKQKPDSVIGFATGSSPEGTYQNLIKMNLDFSRVTSFNLDEYYPIKKSHPQSYNFFMHDKLFDHINIKNVNILNGEAPDWKAECESFDARIEKAGGLDLQILGIGGDGHIAFNEPGDFLHPFTHLEELDESTIDANARFFEKRSDVPTQALTMGMASIMKARKILMLVSGESKKKVFEAFLTGKITTQNPSTMLWMHPDVTVVSDI